jgi:hypothetical protein
MKRNIMLAGKYHTGMENGIKIKVKMEYFREFCAILSISWQIAKKKINYFCVSNMLNF